jgi:UDP-N-acetylmuramate dehydrogenase
MIKPRSLQENVSLAPMTTLKVGGPARFFIRAETEGEVIEAFSYAAAIGDEIFVLGGGSNVLISDRGFDGLVIQPALKRIEMFPEKGDVRVEAGAGEDWDPFVRECVANDLAGLECLSGIPGFVGGTPVQNVGAYGQEVSETIRSVRCFDRKVGQVVELANEECGFEYRRSIFNSSESGRYIVLAVSYVLKRGGAPKLVYRDLVDHFADRTPSLLEVRRAVIEIRRSKSMVIEAGDPNSRSAGSFFKNPIVSQEKYEEIAAAADLPVPSFSAGTDAVKIPAAWLIEQSGYHKGFRMGNAGISSRHTLAIINCGRATASEIVDLMRFVQDGVHNKFGISLQPEPVFVGF